MFLVVPIRRDTVGTAPSRPGGGATLVATTGIQWMKRLFLPWILALTPAFLPAAPVSAPKTTADLVARTTAVAPGSVIEVGLLLEMEPGWHVYWENAGDSGLAPSLIWTLPPGVEAGPIQWPAPHRIEYGPMLNYGYEGTLLLPVRITVPASQAPGTTLRLAAKATWLVCKEACIPGKVDLTLEVPVAAGPPAMDPVTEPLFQKAWTRIPRAAEGWSARFSVDSANVVIDVTAPPGTVLPITGLEFFPKDGEVVENPPPPEISAAGEALTIRLKRSELLEKTPEKFSIVLVAPQPWTGGETTALALDASLAGGAATSEPDPASPSSPPGPSPAGEPEASPGPTGALPSPAAGETAQAAVTAPSVSAVVPAASRPVTMQWALWLAFLGGLILNLMPCVFPVLSIKLLGFVQQSGEDPGKLKKHGLVFGLGVVISFWVLALLLLALRASGEKLGWGFQLQSPGFVTGMIFLFFILSLNLLGVFEIGTGLTQLGGAVSRQPGYMSSFSSGILATLVATPCTAPAMGVSVGFAISLPALQAMTIFTAVAVGMALPYVALSFTPSLLKKLPKPGAWMESLKQLLAFPLLVSVIWLTWVLGKQTSVDAVLRLQLGLLATSMGLWILGRWGAWSRPMGTQWRARIACAVLAVGGLGFALTGLRPVEDPADLKWLDYSPAKLAELRAGGRPVYVDFTAAWCLTCQVNKKVVFGSDAVKRRLAEKDFVLVRADWTSQNPDITRALESFGRSGVPLNVVYPAGPGTEPVILPEILNPSIVLDALNRVAP